LVLAAVLEGEAPTEFAALSLLALIQGLTEFLPISSSGHLVLTQAALGGEADNLLIDVALHVGTLLAVVIVYRRALRALARDVLAGRLRESLLLGLATLPIAVIGMAFKDSVQGVFADPRRVAGLMCGTALILWAGEAARRRHAQASAATAAGGPAGGVGADRPLTVAAALAIGLAQSLAILPGISRSGTTIAAAMLLGYPPVQAARISFLLSIPAIVGAAAVELPGLAAEAGAAVELLPLLWAVLFAGLVGWGALCVLLAFVGRGAFAWFGIYLVAVGGGYLVFA